MLTISDTDSILALFQTAATSQEMSDILTLFSGPGASCVSQDQAAAVLHVTEINSKVLQLA